MPLCGWPVGMRPQAAFLGSGAEGVKLVPLLRLPVRCCPLVAPIVR